MIKKQIIKENNRPIAVIIDFEEFRDLNKEKIVIIIALLIV